MIAERLDGEGAGGVEHAIHLRPPRAAEARGASETRLIRVELEIGDLAAERDERLIPAVRRGKRRRVDDGWRDADDVCADTQRGCGDLPATGEIIVKHPQSPDARGGLVDERGKRRRVRCRGCWRGKRRDRRFVRAWLVDMFATSGNRPAVWHGRAGVISEDQSRVDAEPASRVGHHDDRGPRRRLQHHPHIVRGVMDEIQFERQITHAHVGSDVRQIERDRIAAGRADGGNRHWRGLRHRPADEPVVGERPAAGNHAAVDVVHVHHEQAPRALELHRVDRREPQRVRAWLHRFREHGCRAVVRGREVQGAVVGRRRRIHGRQRERVAGDRHVRALERTTAAGIREQQIALSVVVHEQDGEILQAWMRHGMQRDLEVAAGIRRTAGRVNDDGGRIGRGRAGRAGQRDRDGRRVGLGVCRRRQQHAQQHPDRRHGQTMSPNHDAMMRWPTGQRERMNMRFLRRARAGAGARSSRL